MKKRFLLGLLLLVSVFGFSQSPAGGYTPIPKVKITSPLVNNASRGVVVVRDSVTGNLDKILYSDLSDRLNLESNFQIVNTITEIENYSGFGLTIIVKDSIRGGLFNYVSTGTIDNGTVFEAIGKGSGYWKRQYTQSDGINLQWFGVSENNTDNSVLIEDVISNIGGKIFLPKGTYKIQNTIGDVGDSGTKFITSDTHLYGEEGTVIIVEDAPTTEISSVIGFNMLGSKFTISNIEVDGNGIANRGVYVRQVDVNPDAPFSSVYFDKLKVRNTLIGDNFIENSGAGLYVYGKFESIDIIDCKIDDVVASNATRAVAGIFTSGTASVNRLPKYVNISNNVIKGIYRDGFVNQTDQDGISCLYDLTVLGGQADSKFTIENNKIINAGGRFVKAQQQNGFVNDNLFIIESDFEMPATNTTYGVDLQVSEGVVSNNVFSYNQTTGVSHLSAINFTERSQDTSLHRAIIENNKVFSTPTLPQFCRLIESGNMTGQYVVNSNVVIAPLSNFMNFSSTSSATNVRKFIFSDNTVGSLTTNWINNENSKTIEISLTNNRNNGTSVTVSNVYSKANLIDNIGITEANTYATVTDLNLKSNENEVVKITNNGNPVTAYSSLNANNITGTNIIYATSGTNIPVAGGLLQTNIYATGGTQMYQRFANEDEFYFRNKTGGTWSSNWYRIASREWSNLNFVGLTGNQTKSGVLTLNDSPIVPTATTTGQAVPFEQLEASSQFVSLTEGANTGYATKHRKDNPANYGDIGSGALDLSISNTASSTIGATGQGAISIGGENTASGSGSLVISPTYSPAVGQGTSSGIASVVLGRGTASGPYATVINCNATGAVNAVASGNSATVIGGGFAIGNKSFATQGNTASSFGEVSMGNFGTIQSGSTTTSVGTDRILNIGNGTSSGSLSNAFTILKNGLATLPSVTNTLIDAEATGKAIITKEWAENQTGFASYTDTAYTVGSPYTALAGVTVALPNNAGTVYDDEKPSDITTFYNGTTITGRNGDGLGIMIYFKATPSIINSELEIWIDIGGAIGEIYKQTIYFRGTTEKSVLYSLPVAYSRATWEANGGTVYIKPSVNMDIYGMNFNISRTHRSKN